SSGLSYALVTDTTKLLGFLNYKTIYQVLDDLFGKAARDAHHGRIFFIKEVSGVVGEFKLAAKDEILVIVQHAIVVLVAHRDGRGYGYFKNARASFVVKQNTGKTECFYNAVDHCVCTFALVLNAYAMAEMNPFVLSLRGQ